VPLTSIESEILQMTHADLGAFLLSSWGLPQEIVNAVAWHQAPGLASDKTFSLVTAVHAANAIDHELHAPGNDRSLMDADYLGDIGLGQQGNYWRIACRCPLKK
jgi:HD-like signal output (HDOD) protein